MSLPTPVEIAHQLINSACLTEDQASAIAADVYQPLKDKIDRIENAILAICRSCDLSVSITNAAYDELHGDDGSLTDKVN